MKRENKPAGIISVKMFVIAQPTISQFVFSYLENDDFLKIIIFIVFKFVY